MLAPTPSLLPLLLALLALLAIPSAHAADTCSNTSPCTSSSAPCCSVGGLCGSGSLFCAGGCAPLASKSATSCLPMPVCVNRNVTLSPSDYNDTSLFVPILQYAGNASQALFTLDAGSLAPGPEGVMLQMTSRSLVKLSTTAYILYGDMEVTCRHNATQGVVATMITMSDIHDEIDWEFTTADPSDAQSNYFSQGRTVPNSAANLQPASGTLDVSEWVTYGIRWQPTRLQWLINGRVVRTVSRTNPSYPRSPSRLQLSVWAGGNSTNAPGVIDWSGGPISYTSSEYTSNGYYGMEISSISISCADTSVANLTTVGDGTNGPTSWVFTGANDSSTNYLPAFDLSTSPINFLDDPSQGGYPGVPGYETQTTTLPPGGWDGSGDTGVPGSHSSSSSSSSSKALKYGVPIAAGVVGFILLWAIVVALVRRSRRHSRKPKASTNPFGGIGPNSYSNVSPDSDTKYIPLRESISTPDGGARGNRDQFETTTTAGAAAALGAGGGGGRKMMMMRGESESLGSNYPAAPAPPPPQPQPNLPMGAEFRGAGIGPASGPLPSSSPRRGVARGAYSQIGSRDSSPFRPQQQQQQQQYYDSPLPAHSTNSHSAHGHAQGHPQGQGQGYGQGYAQPRPQQYQQRPHPPPFPSNTNTNTNTPSSAYTHSPAPSSFSHHSPAPPPPPSSGHAHAHAYQYQQPQGQPQGQAQGQWTSGSYQQPQYSYRPR